jgi:hypothetical protein
MCDVLKLKLSITNEWLSLLYHKSENLFFSFICSILDYATYVPKSMNYYELIKSIGLHQSVMYKDVSTIGSERY